MYLIEGTYFTIEDCTYKSLWCINNRDDAEYYISILSKFMTDCKERFIKYLNKHSPELEGGYNDYELTQYMDRVARLLIKKDSVINFWAEAFVGVGYFDYCPSFYFKEIKILEGVRK